MTSARQTPDPRRHPSTRVASTPARAPWTRHRCPPATHLAVPSLSAPNPQVVGSPVIRGRPAARRQRAGVRHRPAGSGKRTARTAPSPAPTRCTAPSTAWPASPPTPAPPRARPGKRLDEILSPPPRFAAAATSAARTAGRSFAWSGSAEVAGGGSRRPAALPLNPVGPEGRKPLDLGASYSGSRHGAGTSRVVTGPAAAPPPPGSPACAPNPPLRGARPAAPAATRGTPSPRSPACPPAPACSPAGSPAAPR